MSLTMPDGRVVEVRRRPSVRDRMDAIAWFTDRGWGKVKDVMKLEGEGRPIPRIIVFNQGDPLDEPEPAPPQKRLPAPPPAQMPEIAFDMEDLENPSPGDPR